MAVLRALGVLVLALAFSAPAHAQPTTTTDVQARKPVRKKPPSKAAIKAAKRRAAKLAALRKKKAKQRAKREAAAVAATDTEVISAAASPNAEPAEVVADAVSGAGPPPAAPQPGITETAPPVAPPPVEQPPVVATEGAPVKTENNDWITSDFIATQKDGTKLFRREVRGYRRKGEIRIDGIVDEEAWNAAPITRFDRQERPHEGAKAKGPSEFRVIYDDDAVYVALHAIDPEPEKVGALLHDPLGLEKVPQSDWFFVYFDPLLNRRFCYVFGINAAGVKIDTRRFSTGDVDDSYAPVWEGRTRRDNTGWWAEIRVPYSQMRVNDGHQDRWGFQVERRVARTQEREYWSPFTFRSSTEVTGWGNLAIENEIDAGRPLELLPYVLGGVRLQSDIPASDPLNDPLTPHYSLGGDLKMQVTGKLRVTATINPDFGQVEADPSQVNLTDKETFFTERRPFFSEDTDLYQLKIRDDEDFFYSRRIGAPPHFSQQDATYLREPDVTTIYGAGKVSGELGAGVNLGVLSATTAKETSVGQLDTGETTTEVIEPLTTYNVLQLSKSFRAGSSEVRSIATNVHRFAQPDQTARLHDDAYAGALSYVHQFADNQFAWSGMVGGSRVEGTPEAIAVTQRASQRYFQRPDATHVEFDPTRTSLSGYTFNTDIRRIEGSIHATLGIEGRSPGFEVNDIGYLTEADVLRPFLQLSYRDTAVNTELMKELYITFNGETVADFAPDVLGHRASLQNDIIFSNYWKTTVSGAYKRSVLDTHLLRGGPAVHGEDAIDASAQVTSDVRSSFKLIVAGSLTSRPSSHSLRMMGGIGLTWNVMSNLELSLVPTITRNTDNTQYVGTAMDTTGMPRYVLGELRQTTLVASARINYTITPSMAILFYAQPFLSGGRFTAYKQSDDVRSSSYDARFAEIPSGAITENMGQLQIDEDGDGIADFSVRKPDFKIARLNSNFVFRWEYRPGSNLYFIWSQTRNGFSRDGAVHAGDVGDVFTNSAIHTFLIKLSYWWSS